MINIYNKLQAGPYKTKMLLQVHDELVFDVYKPELENMRKLIKEEMENAYKLSVPLDVEMDMGANWLEAH
jgi:DNA polymerase-1